MSRVEPLARIAVGVVVGRRKAKSAWVDFVWQPVAILAGVPDAEPWTVLGGDAGYTTFYAGSAEIALYRTESDNYAPISPPARRNSGRCCARAGPIRRIRSSP